MNEPPDFDGLAGLYRWMELASFGPWLWWCRCAWLHQLTGCRHALVLGDGDGRFTRRLLEVCPTLTLDAVDASPAMLPALVRRTGMEASGWRPLRRRPLLATRVIRLPSNPANHPTTWS